MKLQNTKNLAFVLLLIIATITLSFTVNTPKKNHFTNIVTPVNIEEKGFGLLEKIQGQWLGINSVAGMNFNWFAFDYRPISKSHVHGIYEGGSMGNLFTSFFIADFKGTKTIMARNGGVLNGIYRTSYFVLDKADSTANGNYYRLVDAVGGEGTMYMELRFKNDSLYWNSYTSKLGSNPTATRHMTYKGKRFSDSLAKASGAKFDFPQKEAAYDFPTGFDNSYLYMKKSASFLWQSESNDVYAMAKKSMDPVTIKDYPYIASLKIKLKKPEEAEHKQMSLYMSTKPLVDEDGKLVEDVANYNTNVMFPFLTNNEDEFLFTYVHPGDYYVTVVADMNRDFVISNGDLMSKSIPIQIGAEEEATIEIDDITHESDRYFYVSLGNDFYKRENKKDVEEEVPVIDWTITYDNDVQAIIRGNCTTCHGGPTPSADLDLTTLENVKQAIEEKDLIQRMNSRSKPMPPTDMLSLKDRLIVFKWKKDGFIEN